MTVRELIARLQEMDPDRTVIMQSDAEGNGHSPLLGLDGNVVYIPESTWSGYIRDEMPPTEDESYDEEDSYYEDGDPMRAVVLFPIN